MYGWKLPAVVILLAVIVFGLLLLLSACGTAEDYGTVTTALGTDGGAFNVLEYHWQAVDDKIGGCASWVQYYNGKHNRIYTGCTLVVCPIGTDVTCR